MCQAVIEACLDGNLNNIQHIHEHDISVLNYVDPESGNTLLHLVVMAEHVHILKFLLNTSSTLVNHRNADGQSPLHLACALSSCELSLCLLNHEADVNILDNSGFSPLNYALKGNLLLVKLLLEFRANPFIGVFPLHQACTAGVETAYILASFSGINLNAVNSVGNTPLHDAVLNHDIEVAALLLKRGAFPVTVNQRSRTPLFDAISLSYWDIGLLLLGFLPIRGYSLLTNEGYCLFHACSMAEISYMDDGFIKFSIVFNSLLSHSDLVNSFSLHYHQTPLLLAVSKNRVEAVTFLLTFPNINLYHTDYKGQNVFHSLDSDDGRILLKLLNFISKDIEAVQLFLQKDSFLNTPLLTLAKKGFFFSCGLIVRFLETNFAEIAFDLVNEVDIYGDSIISILEGNDLLDLSVYKK
ncbi:hypothetical protein P9112_012319 [Eukaryota sp. TZLM1-RC]